MIDIETFDSIDIHIGTVVSVSVNKRAKKPAYKVDIDFGEDIGVKSTSAQITDLYTPDGSVKSEVRILGADNEKGCVLLTPSLPAENGDRIF